MVTPDSAPPLVPLRSEYERQSSRHPAIWHRHDPLTRRHGPTAAHARAVGHHPPVSRHASRGMPMKRAPAGPRRRRAAPGGGRAMHLTPSPTTEITAVAPWADHERAAWRRGRAPPALRRAHGASMSLRMSQNRHDRPHPTPLQPGAPPTSPSTHQPHQHLAPSLPRYIQGQRLGSSPGR